MSYQKSKHLEAAQKHLSQGKTALAIAEYQQILRQEPKDQNALMTLGDLYVRQNEISRAVEYYQRLADFFLSDGFVSKAIAIHKKIVKLAPGDTESLARLSDLYVQQGVLSEARPIFLQLAELHMKENRAPQAVAVFHQLLEVEPDNQRVRTRLAELHQALGQSKEAAQVFLESAKRALNNGHPNEALKALELANKINPEGPGAQLLRGRALAGTGKATEAIALLVSLPDADSGGDVTDRLIDLYLQTGQAGPAAELAQKAFAGQSEQRARVLDVATRLLEAGEPGAALDLIGTIREVMVKAGETEKLSQILNSIAERLPGRMEPFQWQVEAYRKSNDAFRLSEALELYAQAAAESAHLEESKQAYQELFQRDPANEHIRQSLNQVRAQLGLGPCEDIESSQAELVPEEQAEASAAPVAPVQEAPMDEATQNFINQALTDVDLFSSYGLTQKAVSLLETVLPRAPRHVVILEKLLDLYLSLGDERRTTEVAALLEQIYQQRGDLASTERFAELRRRFQRAAGMADTDLPVAPPVPAPEFVIPPLEPQQAGPQAADAQPTEPQTVEAGPVEAEPALAQAAPQPGPAVHEVDLSSEWATLSKDSGATPSRPPSEPELAPAGLRGEAATDEAMTADHLLRELVSEVQDFHLDALPVNVPEPAAVAAPASGAASAVADESVEQLREVFEEFRNELGGLEEDNEDLETHYNLGIAYREMGLLEEAIGEFQRVAKAMQTGRPFRYAMQCFTLLGLAFMERGEAKIAAMWYQRALDMPGLDQETILALRYDLGIALDAAGDSPAALENFRQVYGINIDYRDVAERIAALGSRR